MDQWIARARDLLRERRLTVTEVALDCGFSHASRRVYDVRPSDIIRSH